MTEPERSAIRERFAALDAAVARDRARRARRGLVLYMLTIAVVLPIVSALVAWLFASHQ